jgi:hypothetical protein
VKKISFVSLCIYLCVYNTFSVYNRGLFEANHCRHLTEKLPELLPATGEGQIALVL